MQNPKKAGLVGFKWLSFTAVRQYGNYWERISTAIKFFIFTVNIRN